MQKMFIDFVDESVRNRLVKAVEIARKHKTMHLFTHYDADAPIRPSPPSGTARWNQSAMCQQSVSS